MSQKKSKKNLLDLKSENADKYESIINLASTLEKMKTAN